MTTATGDFVLDFSGIANTNPYTNADFTAYGDGVSPSFQVSGGALVIGTGAPSICAFRYEGATASGVVSATVELNRDSTVFNDYDGPALIDTSGNGYWLNTNGDDVRLYRMDAWVATRIGAAINQAFSLNDRITIELDPANDTLTTYLEGVEIESVVDSTYTTNLQPAIIKQDNDSNSHGVVSFGASGVSNTSLTTTNTELTHGDVVNLTSSITGATGAKVIDSADNEITLTGFTDDGANGDDRDYSGTFPALSDGLTGLLPDDNWTIEITNGVDTATVTIPRASLDGHTEITVITPAGTYTEDDWAFGLATAIDTGDVAQFPATAGITWNSDGTVTIDTDVFTGGVTITGWAQDITDRRWTRIEKVYQDDSGQGGDNPVVSLLTRKDIPFDHLSLCSVADGQLTIDGVDVTTPCNIYLSPMGGLTHVPNGSPIAQVDVSGDQLIIDGVGVTRPINLYRSPDGGVTSTPNGKPLAIL